MGALKTILGDLVIAQLLKFIRVPLPVKSRGISSANYNGETIKIWVNGRGPYEYQASADEVADFLTASSPMSYAARNWLND